MQRLALRKICDQGVSHAIGEIVLRRISGEILKGQDCDRVDSVLMPVAGKYTGTPGECSNRDRNNQDPHHKGGSKVSLPAPPVDRRPDRERSHSFGRRIDVI